MQFCKEIYGKCWVVSEIFSFVEVSYGYVMVARLRGSYRANTIASSIFFVGGTQAPILDTTYHERSPNFNLNFLILICTKDADSSYLGFGVSYRPNEIVITSRFCKRIEKCTKELCHQFENSIYEKKF